MTLGDIIDHTFRVYRSHFAVIFLFSLLVSGIFNILYAGLAEQLSPIPIFTNQFQQIMDMINGEPRTYQDIFGVSGMNGLGSLLDFMLLMIVSLIMAGVQLIVVVPYVQGGVIGITERFVKNKEADLSYAFTAPLKKLGRLIVTALCLLLYGAAVYIGAVIVLIIIMMPIILTLTALRNIGFIALLLIIIPFLLVLAAFLVLYVFVSLVYPVVMMEDKYHFSAIGRSFQLVRRQFWKAIGMVVLVYLLAAIVGSSLNLGLGWLASLADAPAILSVIIQSIVSAFVSPVLYIAGAMLYFDIRVRSEGLDLEYMAAEAGEITT